MSCIDPASEVVNKFVLALQVAFDPESECPPDGGGTTVVRFFAGDGAPLAAWDAHSQGGECKTPFLWVRVKSRFRSLHFPAPTVDVYPCALPRVLAVEIGVGRCAVVGAEPSWEDYATEAEVSLDDSWRIEKALCMAASALRATDHAVSVDTVTPYGPEGGVIAWTAAAYVEF